MPGPILLCSAPHAGTIAQVRAIAAEFQARSGTACGVHSHSWRDDALARLPTWLRIQRPQILVSCARSGERKARRQKRANPSAFWVHVETLKQDGVRPDLTVIPRHDWLPAMEGDPAVMPVLGAPHGVRGSDLARDRDSLRARYGVAAAQPVSIFLIGGPNPAFDYDAPTMAKILARIEAGAAAGHRCFVSASRRTPKAMQAGLAALQGDGIVLWDGVSANPYRDYLAMGDQFWVTEDSVTMTCEAVATGRPVTWLALAERPGESLDKFRRFHRNWAPYVSAPHFLGTVSPLATGTIALPDDTGAIVGRMLQLMAAR